jgi:hypothetical protein
MFAGFRGCGALQKYLLLQGRVSHDWVMSESMKHLGDLLETERGAWKENVEAFAERLGCSPRTYAYWKDGLKAPTPSSRGRVEEALEWREGSIAEVLAGKWVWGSVEDVRLPDPAARPVKRASELTDDEIAVEMMRRFKNYADKVGDAARKDAPADRWDFGLAATVEDTDPKTPKRRKPKPGDGVDDKN